MASAVMVCGSRNLPASATPQVARVVALVLGSGRSLVVGCASGADAAALRAALHSPALASAPAPVRVFAVGGSSGLGFWRQSARALVLTAPAFGASVQWRAGGSLSLPLRVRLAARSFAAVQYTAAQGLGSGLVAFIAAPPPRCWSGSGPWRSCGSGSWSSVAAAAALGLPVVVFPLAGLAGQPLPALPVAGRWVPAAAAGAWSAGFAFVPAS